jgi:hypothetical protein
MKLTQSDFDQASRHLQLAVSHLEKQALATKPRILEVLGLVIALVRQSMPRLKSPR